MLHRQTLRFLLVALLALCLPSCIESTSPLSDPDNSKPDENLYGVWARTDESEIMVIGRATELGSRKDIPAGIMRMANSSINGNLVPAPDSNLFFVSPLGKESYLNVFGGKDQGWDNREKNSYLLMKYKVAGDKLTIWSGDMDAAARVIEAGTLRGTVTRENDAQKKLKSAKLTDTTANLAKYIQNGGGAVLFPDTGKTDYVRMAMKR